MIDFTKSREELSKQVGIRLDAKQRYLVDIALELTPSETITDYVKDAITRSFKGLSLYEAKQVFDENDEPVDLDPEQERMARELKSLDNLADTLWDESPFVRLEVLSRLGPQIVSDSDKALLNYIRNRADLKEQHTITDAGPYRGSKGYTFNRTKIDAEWDSIRAAFAKSKGKK